MKKSKYDSPITRLREAKGWTLEELGARMVPERSSSTVFKLESGITRLRIDHAEQIATALDVSVLEVLGLADISTRTHKVPVAGKIPAGNWREAIAMSGETQEIPSHLAGDNLFVLFPEGDSMDRVVEDGGYIVVNPDDKELQDKKYYVIMNAEGEATFKRFCANPVSLLPCSSNPEHKPIPMGAEPFLVIGRVVHAGRDL